jgi:hypothetical protein
MSAGGRDEVTFLCTKRMAEKCVIIVAGTTLHDGNQSCCARYSSEREREEVIGVITNGTTWRQGYRDGRAAALNGG